MRKLNIIVKKEEFHRVWNLVVPAHPLVKNRYVQSIPPLVKYAPRKDTRNETTKIPVGN